MDDDVIDWLLLARTPGLGSSSINRLIAHFGNPASIRESSSEEITRLGLSPRLIDRFREIDKKAIAGDVAWLEGEDHHLITLQHPDYPARLFHIAVPPPLLFVKGDRKILNREQIAIVGSRNPSQIGRRIARQISQDLAERGLVITSGLATGIDYCAHLGALENKEATIAVLGHGLDRIYPHRHSQLAGQIACTGALVSEFVTGTIPKPDNFPRRNRIISGMSLGVIVIEAALKSGSLITARYAMEQGREVFAVPGSILNPLSRGCHKLIKEGAKLTEDINDILDELRGQMYLPQSSSKKQAVIPAAHADLDPVSKKLLECIGYSPTSVDELVESSRLTAEAVSSILSVLEIQGLIGRDAGGLYTRLN